MHTLSLSPRKALQNVSHLTGRKLVYHDALGRTLSQWLFGVWVRFYARLAVDSADLVFVAWSNSRPTAAGSTAVRSSSLVTSVTIVLYWCAIKLSSFHRPCLKILILRVSFKIPWFDFPFEVVHSNSINFFWRGIFPAILIFIDLLHFILQSR